MPVQKPKLPPSIWLIFIGLLVVTLLGLFGGTSGGGTDVIPYSQFQQYLDAGKVKQVTISGDTLRGTLAEALPSGNTSFTTVQVPPDLAATLAKHNVEYSAAPSNSALTTLFSWIIPPLLFVGIWMWPRAP